MIKVTVRLKALRQMLNADPEPFCPSSAYVSIVGTLVRDGMAEPAKMRRGFFMTSDGKRELARLEAALLATKRRAG